MSNAPAPWMPVPPQPPPQPPPPARRRRWLRRVILLLVVAILATVAVLAVRQYESPQCRMQRMFATSTASCGWLH